MKSRILSCATITLFAVLATSVRPAAQEQQRQQAKKQGHRYKFVDVGTFGGPASFINPVGNGGPYINSRGTTVGTAATLVPSNPATHGFFCSGLDGAVPFVFHAFAWEDGDVTDLGALASAADNCMMPSRLMRAGTSLVARKTA